jgi:aminomethyltransferase
VWWLLAAGEEFSIRVIAPSQARRIEAGIFNYGSDITLADTPFHVTGLERLVEDQPQYYIGKRALQRLRRRGVDRKLVGIELAGHEPIPPLTRAWPVLRNGRRAGEVTDAVWSPRLAKTIGYVRVPIELTAPGHRVEVAAEHGPVVGVTASIPFVDSDKRVPAASLRAPASPASAAATAARSDSPAASR